ncbi:Peptidase S41 family protein [Penicillium chermesinum]|nr:Peptidase S41 family protein [Penicillium chermesinum]
MHLGVKVFGSIAIAASVAAGNSTRDVEACAQISQLVADANQSKTTASVPKDLAYQCLMSIPFESDRATIFFDSNPPPDYLMPATDILGGVDSILEKVNQKAYSSQFEMELDLSHLIDSAHDSHLVFSLCSQSIFDITIDFPIVSVSTDGLSLPQVYSLSDAKLQQGGSTEVSPLVSINGTAAAKFLESVASSQSLQDPDAQYNRLFPSLARSVNDGATSPDGIWAKDQRWSEASELTLKFGNGTTKTVQKAAVPLEPFFDYKNGSEIYQFECLPRILLEATTAIESAQQASEVSGLPSTPWSSSGNAISGYFSNQTGLEDTAIIFLPTFSSAPADVAHFVINFLQNATAADKKNVLIDVTANTGGYMTTGVDMSRIFFPDSDPYTATRYRAHDAAKYMTKAFSRDTTPDTDNIFAYKQMVKPDQKTGFGSWQDLYGPHDTLGSPSSSLLANFNYTATSTNVWPINGYGEVPLNPPKAPFPAENIAIITDGDCVSTCAFFVKLMKRQGVRTIAFGGRPTEAPMQGVGGVKGGQSLAVNYINAYIYQANEQIRNSANSSSPILTQAEWKNETPLQFVYEAAECRRFYTLENYMQQETVWQAAAKAMFGNGGCVKGSTNGKGSLDAS